MSHPWRVVPSLIMLVTTTPALGQTLTYPKTKKIEQTDVYHGTEVSDPYRWLEEDVRTSEGVREWVEAQNRVTESFLSKISAREPIEERLTRLWNFEKRSTPVKKGGRYYFTQNDGLQNQSVLYVQDSLVEEPRVLIDPNTWSEDGTVALAGTAFSDDGRYLAYGVAESGSDWRTWRVMEIQSGRVLPDEIRWVKFSEAEWDGDGKGFFYGRYPEPRAGARFQSLNTDMKVYYHRLGTPQDEDVVVYERPDQPEWGFGTKVTEDGRYLVITVWKGTDARYQVLYKDLEEPHSSPVTLIGTFENDYTFFGNDGPHFFFRTDLGAPRGRVIAIDIREPARDRWREVIPQQDATLLGASYIGNLLVAEYLQDAKSRVRIFTDEGKHVRDVPLGEIGTVTGFSGRRTDSETFYTLSSFTIPPTTYRYDVATGEQSLVHQPDVDFVPEQYEVRQVFYRSKDGTRIPMFLAHRKGLELDGSNPTLLYGYGGFNVSLTPGFSVSRLVWMEMGGVLAIPNLRGGGEYGEEWHEAGTKLQKQNVFDDFIAAAEWLIENRYTRPSRLAIQGGSNGGLLVGAAMTQRPELFGAALPSVGVMDMLRFHKFTAGRFWVDDYGSADDAKEFAAIYAYSPYHRLKEGVAYPATLVTTADTDDRVVPAHSFKFAARLQESQGGKSPVLIRIETRAGHGAGTPTKKLIEEIADEWAFLVANLGVEYPR